MYNSSHQKLSSSDICKPKPFKLEDKKAGSRGSKHSSASVAICDYQNNSLELLEESVGWACDIGALSCSP